MGTFESNLDDDHHLLHKNASIPPSINNRPNHDERTLEDDCEEVYGHFTFIFHIIELQRRKKIK